MQLMKLTYIANGLNLALNDESLFSNRIEAWKYGPVMPDLYHATKQYGKKPIPDKLIQDGFEDLPESLRDKVDFLKDVYSLYERMDGIELSSLTHMPGTPWDLVYSSGETGMEIPNSLIKEHYAEMLVSSDER